MDECYLITNMKHRDRGGGCVEVLRLHDYRDGIL